MKSEKTYRYVTLIALGITLVLAVLLILFFFRGRAPKETTAMEAGNELQEKAITGESTVDEIALPVLEALPQNLTLAQSDDWLRSQALPLSGSADYSTWLAKSDLIRRFVAVTNNISRGESPARHLDFLQPTAGFKVKRQAGILLPDPVSFKRYDRLTTAATSIDLDRALILYRRSMPLLAEADRELGNSGDKFTATLLRAIDELLQTPFPTQEIILEERTLSFEYADPRLENLSPAQKHFLRLGPENMKKWQDFLKKAAEKIKLLDS